MEVHLILNSLKALLRSSHLSHNPIKCLFGEQVVCALAELKAAVTASFTLKRDILYQDSICLLNRYYVHLIDSVLKVQSVLHLERDFLHLECVCLLNKCYVRLIDSTLKVPSVSHFTESFPPSRKFLFSEQILRELDIQCSRFSQFYSSANYIHLMIHRIFLGIEIATSVQNLILRKEGMPQCPQVNFGFTSHVIYFQGII